MIYVSFYFWTVFTYTALCNVQVWLFILGYDIMMGALLVKNMRLAYIFYNAKKLKAVKVQNWQLLLAIFLLVAIDAVVIIIYEAAFPIKAWRIPVQIFKPVYDYVLCGTYSGSDYIQVAFIGTLGALKAFLILIFVVLSIIIRKQPSEFNESKAIAYAVYNQAFCIICLLVIWLVITDDNYVLKYILRSFIVLWGTSITLIMIFGRKLYYIAIGKNKAFRGARSTASHSNREKLSGESGPSDREPVLNLK